MKASNVVIAACFTALCASGTALASSSHSPSIAQGQGQEQGQKQGQGQAQGQLQKANAEAMSSSLSKSIAGASAGSSSSTGDVNVNVTEGAGSDNSVNVADNSRYEAQRRNPVNTAWAAPLVATGSCMGSTSLGGQGITLGLSFAKTWTDSDCNRRAISNTMWNQQRPNIALSVMCNDKEVLNAVRLAGTHEEKVHCGLVDAAPVVAPVVAPTTEAVVGERG